MLTLTHSGPAIAVLGTSSEERTLAPGEAFEGAVILENAGAAPETARIFQADFACSAEGRTTFAAPGTLPRSNAGWFTVPTSLLLIPGGETAAFSYHGCVPAAGGLQGTFWSIIMVENVTPLEAGTSGIRTLARYGTQVITNVGEGGRRSVRFGRREFVRERTTVYALFDLENDGERLVFPRLWLDVYDLSGARLGRFGGETARLYPDCSARYRVELPGLPRGAFQAQLVADCGPDRATATRISFVL